MVSQGDITLLQRITQPKAQSQLVSGSAGPACGERRGTAAPYTRHWNWASFQGKTGLLSPPRPGREFRAENANESGSSAIFVANDRSGLSYTKPVGSNYMVNMKCLSL